MTVSPTLPTKARVIHGARTRTHAYWWSKLTGKASGTILTCAGCATPHEQDTIACIYLAEREAILAPLCPACDALLADGRGEPVARRLEALRPHWRPHTLPDGAGGGVVNVLDLRG
jgi:hypothetical protein